MSNKTILIAFGVAVLIVAGLVASRMKQGTYSPAPQTNNNQQNGKGNNTTPPKNMSQEDLLKLLATDPGASGTNQQMEDYSNKVHEAAVKTSVLDLTDCSANPRVMEIKDKTAITIKNSNSQAHTLTVGNKTLLVADANSEKSVTPNIPGPGIIGYACDGNGPVGAFFIIP